MRRGSVHTWEDYGRRSSANMSPFSGSRAEFMTFDNTEGKRNDGWFLSYPKLAAVIVVFILGLLAAGFLGWYINSLPKKKTYDTLDIITEEIEGDDIIGSEISPFVHPVKYHLDLMPIIEGGEVLKIKGHVTIEFQVDPGVCLSELSLNAKNITAASYKLFSLNQEESITAVTRTRRKRINSEINNKDYAADKLFDNKTPSLSGISKRSPTEVEIVQYEQDDNKELHTIHFARPIERGTYLLEIHFQSWVNDDAFYIANYHAPEEKWFMGTRLKRASVRSLFPVFDNTDLKSVFSVSVTRPEEMRVVSNMPLRTSASSSENHVTDVFDESPPLLADNLAFVMGYMEPTERVPLPEFNIQATFWRDSEKNTQGTYITDKLIAAATILSNMFSMPYPLPKLDLVRLPAEVNENVGKPGLILMKPSQWSTMLNSSVIMKTDAARELIYVLGQQWLGGVINMNWADTWVLEGTLLYLQDTLIHQIDSSLDSDTSFLVNAHFSVMETDGYSVSRALYTNTNHPYSDSYDDLFLKGACLIRMLHGAIGNTGFWNGYKRFIAEWKYKTVSAAQFFSTMSENATDLPLEFSLEQLMNSWISQSGYPVVSVRRDYEAETVKIRQMQFTYDTLLDESAKLWYIPLTYVSGNNNWSAPETTWLLSEREMILKDVGQNESWIVFNINKTGYYRVHYDERNWALLKAALDENHETFPPETRASLIDDAFSLASVGLTKYETAFDLIKYMQMKERHYVPWGALMNHVLKLNRLLYETSAFPDFQDFMLKFISPLYDEVGSKFEEGTLLTLTSVQLACAFEHVECLDRSKKLSENIQTDLQAMEDVPAYIRKTFYCTIARYGTRKEWNFFVENATSIANKEERERFLSALGCFQTPWILQAVLNDIVHGTTFHEDEIPVILRSFPDNSAAAQVASRFVRANWVDIVERFSGSYPILRSFILSMVNGLTTEQDVEDLQEFIENNYENLKGARYATAIVEANANFTTWWLKNSLNEVEELLRRNVTI